MYEQFLGRFIPCLNIIRNRAHFCICFEHALCIFKNVASTDKAAKKKRKKKNRNEREKTITKGILPFRIRLVNLCDAHTNALLSQEQTQKTRLFFSFIINRNRDSQNWLLFVMACGPSDKFLLGMAQSAFLLSKHKQKPISLLLKSWKLGEIQVDLELRQNWYVFKI